ncbi:MAG: hypothetical protein P1P93_08010 [Gammaproteobacteria bacterium]|nr:hypothetical protein [Gammaproteobacteria bacterium]
MSSLAKHVIYQPKPYRCLIIVTVAVLLTAVLIWFYLTQSNESLLIELSQLKQQQQQLLNQNQHLQQQLKSVQHQLEDKNQFIAIQSETDTQLKRRLDELQNKVVHLNKELMFYQTITQGNTSSKLQIRELELNAIATDKPENISYRVVITQGERITKPLTGIITLTLNYDTDKHDVISEHQLNLRHVQVLEGTLKLADNIAPNSITITLKQNKKITLSQSFDWQIAKQN